MIGVSTRMIDIVRNSLTMDDTILHNEIITFFSENCIKYYQRIKNRDPI